MKRILISILTIALLAGSAFGITYDADYYATRKSWVMSQNTSLDPLYLFMNEVGNIIEGEIGTGVFWFVDSAATGQATGESWEHAVVTIDAAINLSDADSGADRGDRIYVAQGHAYTKSATGALFTADVNGISIMCLGKGDNRAKLTLSHTGATIDITANNVRFSNFYLDATGVDSVDAPLNVSGEGCILDNFFIRLGDTNGQADKGITIGLADGDANDLIIANGVIVAPDTGAVSAITFAFDMENVILVNLYIYGDFTTAAVEVPSGGDAQENLTLDNCTIISKNSGQPAFEANGTGNTGVIRNSVLISDAEATIVDAGGLQIANSTSLLLIGDSEGAALPANMTLIDLIGDYTGPDSGSAADDNIKAHLDLVLVDTGTTLPAQINDYSIQYIKKTGVILTGGTVEDVFVVAGGPIMVKFLGIEITTDVSANACNVGFTADPTAGAGTDTPIAATTTDIASAAIGDWFSAELDGTTPVKKAIGTALPCMGVAVDGIVVPIGGIDLELQNSSPSTGICTVWMAYIPMDTAVAVTAP